jgi:arginyl-tRNA synthetase
MRWAAALGTGEAGPQRPPADPGELALLDALSWLPERVAIAARRSRPDEFARYLEDVARVTLATLAGPGNRRSPGNDRLALAAAARTGLAAGLGLLGVSAPDRL